MASKLEGGLPVELYRHIATFLDSNRTFCALSCVSDSWQDIAEAYIYHDVKPRSYVRLLGVCHSLLNEQHGRRRQAYVTSLHLTCYRPFIYQRRQSAVTSSTQWTTSKGIGTEMHDLRLIQTMLASLKNLQHLTLQFIDDPHILPPDVFLPSLTTVRIGSPCHPDALVGRFLSLQTNVRCILNRSDQPDYTCLPDVETSFRHLKKLTHIGGSPTFLSRAVAGKPVVSIVCDSFETVSRIAFEEFLVSLKGSTAVIRHMTIIIRGNFYMRGAPVSDVDFTGAIAEHHPDLMILRLCYDHDMWKVGEFPIGQDQTSWRHGLNRLTNLHTLVFLATHGSCPPHPSTWEEGLCRDWTRYCPTLRNITFPSQASYNEWHRDESGWQLAAVRDFVTVKGAIDEEILSLTDWGKQPGAL